MLYSLPNHEDTKNSTGVLIINSSGSFSGLLNFPVLDNLQEMKTSTKLRLQNHYKIFKA